MVVFSKIISFFLSIVMAILNIFGLGGEKRPEFVLGENVNSNAVQVLEVYNNAVIKTDEDAPLVTTTMSLEDLVMDGMNAGTVTMLKSMMNDMLAEEAFEDYDIPGKGELTADDVVSAKMSTEEGLTTVIIKVKEQIDDGYGNAKGSAPVSRAMSTLGNVAGIMEETDFISGGENLEITYTDCTLACIIDDATGMILYGEWYYNVTLEMDGLVINAGESPLEISDVSYTMGYKSVL